MAITKTRDFQVTARIVSIVSIDVTAESLEAAVAKSKDFDYDDFITVDGDLCDGSFQVVGVSQNESWNTD